MNNQSSKPDELRDKLDTVTGYSFSSLVVEGMNFAVNGPNDERPEWDASDWRIHESIVVKLWRRIFTATREQEPATL
ncbi:MAG TPA: hypothetical protein VFO16_03850 [Pseudonocardiaceae bacterium]|nr:hypothetical protein [Pseudonocardiaceae bacterium]